MLEEIVARGINTTPGELLKIEFDGKLQNNCTLDAVFLDSSFKRVFGVSNLEYRTPVALELLKNNEFEKFLSELAGGEGSVLININSNKCELYLKKGNIEQIVLPNLIAEIVNQVISDAVSWAGFLNMDAEHVVDLKTPSPGPHFNVNLLLGNRLGFPNALQTTPKSVVDRFGGGGFRSHAATQVLATRWDLRQEENGFPANRQFYILENGKKIFYSADATDSNVEFAECTHSQNNTVIKYKTKCGLEIKRTIFILPQIESLPLATEVQQIEIKNATDNMRKIKIVYTGMFGSAAPHAIFEDVLYSNIIMQTKLLKNADGTIAAIGPDYYPEHGREDLRFHVMMLHSDNGVKFPNEFCANYNEFVGNGSIINPEGLYKLSCNMYRKGPGFFAVAGEIGIKPGETSIVDNFTGLVSNKTNPDFNNHTFLKEIQSLISRFEKPGSVMKENEENKKYFSEYRGYFQVQSEDEILNAYINKNLPFQVLYQTFVSRSFCQTQKGYREIGFREIQDLFASMYYFVAMGNSQFVKQLLKEWCSKVFEFGFAYHNFFWVGKEPGKWSDDALWFVQAVYRYINLTGEIGFLDEECEIAGTNGAKLRPVYDTIKAILRYSGEISIGKHGIPLLDFADWNDCLKLDSDYIDGIQKEKQYEIQLNNTGNDSLPLDNKYSESVMNGFLLKTAIDEMIVFANEKGDNAYGQKLSALSKKLYDNLQKHAWKDDFFARVLFNRYANNEFTYLGAKGDDLSLDPELDGTYFLNSFSWAIISDSATEEQINTMLDVVEKVLKTPFGLKLVTPAALNKIANDTATGHYFPGDRENGAVFKHASMMAAAALFKAAKEVKNNTLALRLSNLAYWMIDLVLPFKTMENPYVTCGNPRFCTQYNNSETGENIGPMLSGTSTWLTLTLMSAFGIEYTRAGIEINPILREDMNSLLIYLNTGKAKYKINMEKPSGFYRINDCKMQIYLDECELKSNIVPILNDNKEHSVKLIFG